MASTSTNSIMLTGQARVFIAEHGSGCGKEYDYYNCMKVEGLSKDFGDTDPIYCQDKNQPGRFKQVAAVRGEESLWTSSLSGYKYLSLQSVLARMARARCKFDLQVHYGVCANLSDFNTFDSAIIFEDVLITDYNIDNLGALQPSENAAVLESVSISAANVYEVFEAQLVRTATGLVEAFGPVAAVTFCGPSCDDDCSDPCANIFAIQLPLTYTGLTANDSLRILHSSDGGTTWDATTFPASFPAAGVPLGSINVVCSGEYLVISMNTAADTGVILAVNRDSINGTTTTDFTQATFGYTITGMKTLNGYIYAAASTGRIVRFKAGSLSPEDIEDGTQYTNSWFALDGINKDNMIFGGGVGTLAHRRKGASLRTVTVTDSTGAIITVAITAVAMKSTSEWYVGLRDGRIFCTADSGINWELVATLPGCVGKIIFPTKNVGYATVRNQGAVYRTIDGGSNWSAVDTTLAGITANTTFDDIASCSDDPWNFITVGHTAVTPTCDRIAELTANNQTGLLMIGD